jgi:hypothetical protein
MTAISPIEGLEELAQTAYDLLAKDPKAAQKLLADGVQMLRDHQIELLSRPSPDPGVEAEDKANAGAGPKQLKFQSEFMARKHRIMAAAGANRCLGPDTLIDRPDGPSRKVSEICGEHEVWAWDGEKKVRAMAGEPFIKGYDLCYRIHLSNGRQVDCSANHRVLCVDGRWSVRGPFRTLAFQLVFKMIPICREKKQVINRIVVSHAVYVMHYLAWEKITT